MSDFVTRLQHELERAAEREASPARRLAARTPRVLVPVLAAACAALLAVGLLRTGDGGDDRPQPIRPPIVPTALLGSWSGDGAAALIIDRDRYTLRRGSRSTSGDLAATSANELLLDTDAGGGLCASGVVGRYRIDLAGDTLRLVALGDGCGSREAALSEPLHRDG